MSANTMQNIGEDEELDDSVPEEEMLRLSERNKDPEGMSGSGHSGRGTQKKELSTVSRIYDVDGKGFLTPAQTAARELDTDGKGYLNAEKVVELIDQKIQIEVYNKQLKKAVVILVVVAILLALSNLGTAFAAARLAKDTEVKGGALKDKATGEDISTKSTVTSFTVTSDGGITGESGRMLSAADDKYTTCLSNQEITDQYAAISTLSDVHMVFEYGCPGNSGQSGNAKCSEITQFKAAGAFNNGTHIGFGFDHPGQGQKFTKYVFDLTKGCKPDSAQRRLDKDPCPVGHPGCVGNAGEAS